MTAVVRGGDEGAKALRKQAAASGWKKEKEGVGVKEKVKGAMSKQR